MIDTNSIKAVIFDYDGVIIDSDPFSRYAFGEVLKQKGILPTDEIYKKYFAGRKLEDSITLFLKPMNRLSEIKEFISLKKSFDSEYGKHVVAYDDAVKLISRLKGKYRLAIATGSRRVLIDTAFKKLGLGHVFEVVICAEDYKKGKPDPEIYLKSLEKLNISPNEAVVIEDAPWGIEAAQRAGIRCIAVTHTHSELDLKQADLIVKNLLDINLEV